MSRSFNHEEFEAAKSAWKNSKQVVSNTTPSSSGHDESEDHAWFKRSFPQDALQMHPDVQQEISSANGSSVIDLVGFCQGAAGPADQRYFEQLQHAAQMQIDPNLEKYHEDQERFRRIQSSRTRHLEDDSSTRNLRRQETSTFFFFLRLFLISLLSSCGILYLSASMLPQEGTSSVTSLLWFIQVFSIILIGNYFSATSS